MLRISSVIGLAALSAVAATATVSVSAHPGAAAEVALAANANEQAPTSGKGDRIKAVSFGSEGTVVFEAQIVNSGVVLRDREGVVLYRSDQGTSTTSVAKGAALPPVMVGEGAGSARPAAPAQRIEAREEHRKLPIGCERTISSLAGKGAKLTAPGLCLA